MVVTIPLAAASTEPSRSVENNQLSMTADIPEPPPPQSEFVPQSVVESPGGPAKDKSAEPVNGVSAILSRKKIRFGLFGKITIVMLIVGLLPFAVFWGITFRETFESYNRMQEFALILLAGTVLLVLIIAWFSARAIVRPIMKLTDAAERMSLGELNVRIDIKSKDEIGLLAQAIGRLQTCRPVSNRP
jgi:HAMP domain-containing protein